jgi:predicted S18 family serine protease
MVVKCITKDFPDRVTYGKNYEVVEQWKNSYYIVDDNKKLATVTFSSSNNKFIDLEEWREQQIKKIIKNSMSHLEGYSQYLVSNANTLLNYIRENNVEYSTSSLVELIDNINNNSHGGDRLEFYAEQLDRTIAMAQNDFGYIHNREHNSVH